jgi:hypothetical protein
MFGLTKIRPGEGIRLNLSIHKYASAVIPSPAQRMTTPVGVEKAAVVAGCVERSRSKIHGAAADR